MGEKTMGMIYLNGVAYDASDYSSLSNKPSINGVPLVGNKTANDLNIVGTVDSALSTTSENAVQNKVVTAELNNKAATTYVDTQIGYTSFRGTSAEWGVLSSAEKAKYLLVVLTD